jgi:hypothetical protein
MAAKRETKRERREVAKQRRMEELRRRQRKARMRKFYFAGIAVLVIGAIVAGVMLAGSAAEKDKKDLNALASAAGCTRLQEPASEGADHVAAPTRVTYKTNPPSSGRHYGQTSLTGILPNPLPQTLQDENLVHNMEHGQVIFWYKPDLDPTLLDKFKAIVRDDARRLILVPRATMEYQVAFTAWAKLIGCPTANDRSVAVAQKFADTFKGKGPEGTGDNPGTPTGV